MRDEREWRVRACVRASLWWRCCGVARLVRAPLSAVVVVSCMLMLCLCGCVLVVVVVCLLLLLLLSCVLLLLRALCFVAL